MGIAKARKPQTSPWKGEFVPNQQDTAWETGIQLDSRYKEHTGDERGNGVATL